MKTKAITLDEKTEELIKRIGATILYDEKVNVSRIIRYCVRFTANELLEEK